MKQRGLILVFFTALISGFSIFINKFGVSETNPYIFVWLKNTVVVVFLLSTILLINKFKELVRLKRNHWIKLSLIGLIGGSIPFLLFFKGLQLTDAASASFIHKTMFVFVTVLALFFLKEKIDRRIIIASILILAGNLFILKLKTFSFNNGDMLILIATILWSMEVTLSKYTLNELSGEIVAFGRMFFGSVFILLFLLATGNIKDITSITSPQIAWVMLTSVFLFLYVFTFYNGLKLVKAHVAASVLLLGSLITMLLSIAYFGTEVTINQGIGFLLLVAGIILITLTDIKHLFRQILSWRAPNGWR